MSVNGQAMNVNGQTLNGSFQSISWDRCHSTPEKRWARLGPYYAMFPLGFAQQAIAQFTRRDELVVDPFCGRGTVPYVAMVNSRSAVACEINPVAWIYTAVKTAPARDHREVKTRIREIADSVSTEDRTPESEFQQMAFCPDILGFLNAARRLLQWRTDTVDRTAAAFILHYLHSKIPQGLSNQMRHCRAMAPDYCIRWWNDNGYSTPPDIDPVAFLHKRIDWRYQKGIPASSDSNPGSSHTHQVKVELGDSAAELPVPPVPARLVVTSPPYSAVTDYRVDNWLRLWAIRQAPALPTWSSEHKYVNLAKYRDMIRSVFTATARIADDDTVWLVRCDARQRTLKVIRQALSDVTAGRRLYTRNAPFTRSTQTALYGDSSTKPGEIDLLSLPRATQLPDSWKQMAVL